MTCCEGFTSCNGFFLMSLSIIAMVLNLLPMMANYAMDGQLFENPVSCFEWWLPGLVGGGILVLPAVSMAFAAKKGGSCNSRIGMLLSAFLCIVSIIGALYCVLISLFALGSGPLICKGPQAGLSSCDFSIKNISSYSELNFDITWYLEADGCRNVTERSGTGNHFVNADLSIDLNEAQLVNLHLITFAGLSAVALLEIIFSVLQIMAGLCGCVCGTSNRTRPV
ncbi:transmembrane 4 L6 family member 20 [Amia ocellicauda]|uniref:transmembrane 4 L6 family member 20 n=1 Tax=Amia ocellicauda TaxID=2972642 RepID=UPI00346468B8|nr:T4S20 protein [Amia calva]